MNNKLYYFLDGHPNERGHEKIASDIFDYLSSNYSFYCNSIVNK
jgi:hypothetical protein